MSFALILYVFKCCLEILNLLEQFIFLPYDKEYLSQRISLLPPLGGQYSFCNKCKRNYLA